MTNLQAFVLVFIVLLVQTITLIVFGFIFDKNFVTPTLALFVIVDFCLIACADILKVVKKV